MLPLAERAVRSAEQAGTTFNRLVPSIERAVTVAENLPKLITSEREEALRAMHEELTRSIEFMREERIAALEGITRERIAAVKDLQGMVAAEHKSLVADMGQISFKLVDHAFWRAAQLIAATVALLTIGLAVLATRFRKRV
jgi:hypothetical protein